MENTCKKSKAKRKSQRKISCGKVFVIAFLLLVCPAFSSEWSVEADALYWKVNEDDLSYALESRAENGKDVLKQPKFEWDFGFKLAVGYRLPHDQWSLWIRLASLHTHTDALLHAKDGKTLYPIWITAQENGPLSAQKIKMHWRLHLGLIDALVKKDIYASTHFIIHPQVGLRYAIARQKFNLDYLGGMFLPSNEEYVRMKNKFWGIGPYGSLGIQWLLPCHFSLCAAGGLSCPYGQFYRHEDEDLFEGHVKIFGMRDTLMRIAVIADANLILRWQKVWEKAKKKLSLQAGWDALLLFKQNRLMRFFESSPIDNAGNLGLKGWQWGLQLDF